VPFAWLDDVAVDQRAHCLDGEQRDALGVQTYRPHRVAREPGHQSVEQLLHRRGVQRVQRQGSAVAPGAEPWPRQLELRTGEDQDEHRDVARPVDQVVQKVEQTGVGVLRVLDEQHDRLHLGQPLEEQPPAGEELLARHRRLRRLG
jgi:hypothetical protein